MKLLRIVEGIVQIIQDLAEFVLPFQLVVGEHLFFNEGGGMAVGANDSHQILIALGDIVKRIHTAPGTKKDLIQFRLVHSSPLPSDKKGNGREPSSHLYCVSKKAKNAGNNSQVAAEKFQKFNLSSAKAGTVWTLHELSND